MQETDRASRVAMWIGGSAAVVGVLIFIGYGSHGVPIPIQVAVPVVVAGILILLATALVERLSRHKQEYFNELKH